MKKIFFVALIAICLFISACGQKSPMLLSYDEAQNALLSRWPNADILSFRLSETQSDYIAVFSASDGFSLALIDAESGHVHDVQPLVFPAVDNTAGQNENNSDTENPPAKRLSEKDALAIAHTAADTAGDLVLMHRTYDPTSNSYLIILKGGNIEYRYVIDAESGDIVSSAVNTDM